MEHPKIQEILKIQSAKYGSQLSFDKQYYWEFDNCIVFGYNSALFLETGEMQHALVGNLPFVFSKDDADKTYYRLVMGGLDHCENRSIQELIDNEWIIKVD